MCDSQRFPLSFLVCTVFTVFTAAACGLGPTDSASSLDAAIVDQVESLQISPADVELVVKNGVAAVQVFSVLATLSNGETRDVSTVATFTLNSSNIGNFLNSTFTTSNIAGGASKVRVTYGGAEALADIRVQLNTERVLGAAPDNAADLFDAASDDPGLAPVLLYPAADTYMPPNIGDFEVHWQTNVDTDLYEVRVTSRYSSVRLFVTADASAGAFSQITPEDWKTIGQSARGSDIEFQVRAMRSATPTSSGSSEMRRTSLTDTDIKGGIYYWASAGALAEGVYRHDMSRPGEPAEAFYTIAESPEGRCVACHVLSRDGEKMAVTFDGGNGAGTIIDVSTKIPLLAVDRTFEWNFATFEPSGDRFVTVRDGVLALRDVATGTIVNTVPTPGPASHPNFAAAGDKIVYASFTQPSSDWNFRDGSLVIQSFDAGAALWGAPTTLYQPSAGLNAYYPSFSPDGNWVLFNLSSERAYDVASAQIYVMRADGTSPPILLESPDLASGLTNSWAQWAPFTQTLNPDNETSEEFFWLTFSSKRAFGVRLAPGKPQVWMAPFFPSRVAAGTDPSAPAFRLPFQEISTNNHIAQWTTKVVPID